MRFCAWFSIFSVGTSVQQELHLCITLAQKTETLSLPHHSCKPSSPSAPACSFGTQKPSGLCSLLAARLRGSLGDICTAMRVVVGTDGRLLRSWGLALLLAEGYGWRIRRFFKPSFANSAFLNKLLLL